MTNPTFFPKICQIHLFIFNQNIRSQNEIFGIFDQKKMLHPTFLKVIFPPHFEILYENF